MFCYKVTTRETVLIIQKFNAVQDKVSFIDSSLVVMDDRHGTYLVVDGRL